MTPSEKENAIAALTPTERLILNAIGAYGTVEAVAEHTELSLEVVEAAIGTLARADLIEAAEPDDQQGDEPLPTFNNLVGIREDFERLGLVRDSGQREDGWIVWELVPDTEQTGHPWPRRGPAKDRALDDASPPAVFEHRNRRETHFDQEDPK